jgi:hypothetical protein
MNSSLLPHLLRAGYEEATLIPADKWYLNPFKMVAVTNCAASFRLGCVPSEHGDDIYVGTID